MSKPKIHIGTSGWHYGHWTERFYPADLPKDKWLKYYAKHFDTVEINSTFYHQPNEISVKRWYEQVPKRFIFVVKASRFITHIKRLKNAEEPLKRLFEIISLLKEKLGPVLYQLPPGLHKNPELLENFISLLPKRPPAVFEFRHKSWFEEDIFKLLDKFGVGFCVHDLSGVKSPCVITGDIIYIRFHGTTGRYSGNYSNAALKSWANWIKENLKASPENPERSRRAVSAVYVYFNNDFNAYAVFNAKTLKEQLRIL